MGGAIGLLHSDSSVENRLGVQEAPFIFSFPFNPYKCHYCVVHVHITYDTALVSSFSTAKAAENQFLVVSLDTGGGKISPPGLIDGRNPCIAIHEFV